MSELAKHIKGMEELDDSSICYWHTSEGWFLYLPGCGIGGLGLHQITEHEDGSITASPSVLMKGHKDGQPTHRHGFLEHGVWREV